MSQPSVSLLRYPLVLTCAAFSLQTFAQSAPAVVSLPDPLTLDAALAIAADQSPEVVLSHADLLLQQADRQVLEAKDAFQLRFEGGFVRREFAGREESFDNAYLLMQKQLYDFGKQQALISAADAQLRAQEWLETQARQIYRQRVVETFFDVLLADLTARVENEQMAIDFVTLDNAKEEQAVGKKSALDILTIEESYQKTLVKRNEAESAQRLTRAALAELLGFATQLPSELEVPDISSWQKKPLEEPKLLQQKAVAQNTQLKALEQLLIAAEMKLSAAEKMDAPRIDFLARNGWHTHVDDRYDGRFRYDLVISMPILDGGLKAAEVDKAKASLMRQKASYEQMTRQVRQVVLDTALKIGLLKSRREQVRVLGDYAEMNLDKNRTEYQYERKTDLGDALVKASRAELETLKVSRDTIVLWEQLLRLTGEK